MVLRSKNPNKNKYLYKTKAVGFKIWKCFFPERVPK